MPSRERRHGAQCPNCGSSTQRLQLAAGGSGSAVWCRSADVGRVGKPGGVAGRVGGAAAVLRRTLKLIMVELKRMREWLDWMKPMPPMSA